MRSNDSYKCRRIGSFCVVLGRGFRYIICKGLRKSYSDTVRDYLKRVNQQLDELEKAKSSNYVNSVVPLDTLLSNEAFLSGLTEHNERSAIRQTTYLQKYFTYVQNKSLIDKDQSDRSALDFKPLTINFDGQLLWERSANLSQKIDLDTIASCSTAVGTFTEEEPLDTAKPKTQATSG
ncbi:unnamed protein product [Heligmosomoides polygyrus]|uniref:Cap-specific mRNA (nucleoside-2'-O-)-methyltransferase 1 n=1 Tax=Heligmosomoides polygyrus TaxID=6339 RepID=A0A3P8BX44_HELPZ|nr:unnamed protein product [Heligmosomoides polygyrus]